MDLRVLMPGFLTLFIIPVFFMVFYPAILGPLFCIKIGGKPAPTPITPDNPEVLSPCSLFVGFFLGLSPRCL